MCNCSNCNTSITSTQGPKGNKGDTGATGATGATGPQGPQGPAGASGTVTVSSATYAPPAPDEATGTVVYLNRAAGITVTLPPSPPEGTEYTFVAEVTANPGSYTINTSSGDVLLGFIYGNKASSSPSLFTANAALSDTHFTMNGSTTGGAIGTEVTFKYMDTTNNIWYVTGDTYGSAVLATPFS